MSGTEDHQHLNARSPEDSVTSGGSLHVIGELLQRSTEIEGTAGTGAKSSSPMEENPPPAYHTMYPDLVLQPIKLCPGISSPNTKDSIPAISPHTVVSQVSQDSRQSDSDVKDSRAERDDSRATEQGNVKENDTNVTTPTEKPLERRITLNSFTRETKHKLIEQAQSARAALRCANNTFFFFFLCVFLSFWSPITVSGHIT